MTDRESLLQQHFLAIDGAFPKDGIAKHKKMATSGFLFYRGSSQLFYRDIKDKVFAIPEPLLTVPLTTIMGDCHTANFGFITEEGSHGDKVIFTVNDFDDACIGHAVWDLARFITCLFVSVDHCQQLTKGTIAADKCYRTKAAVSTDDAILAANRFIDSYLTLCQQSIDSSDCRYQAIDHFDDNPVLNKRYQKALSRASNGANFASDSTLAKVICWHPYFRFASLPDKFKTLSPVQVVELKKVFAPYVDDVIHDIVERLNAGTGSVNMHRYYLLVGPKKVSQARLNLCHLVEVKQQRIAAPLYFYEDLSPVNQLNPAHLTVVCQQKMQRRPDLVLDEVIWQQAHWLVRSRHHAKVSIKPEHIGIGKKVQKYQVFSNYAGYCGKALALAHCRGDRRSNLFEQAIVKQLSRFKQELIDSCQHYSQQVLADTKCLQKLLA